VHMGRSVEDFYRDLEAHTDHGKTLPNWCAPACRVKAVVLTAPGAGMASCTSSSTAGRTRRTVRVARTLLSGAAEDLCRLDQEGEPQVGDPPPGRRSEFSFDDERRMYALSTPPARRNARVAHAPERVRIPEGDDRQLLGEGPPQPV
jgi:hypothetical protein